MVLTYFKASWGKLHFWQEKTCPNQLCWANWFTSRQGPVSVVMGVKLVAACCSGAGYRLQDSRRLLHFTILLNGPLELWQPGNKPHSLISGLLVQNVILWTPSGPFLCLSFSCIQIWMENRSVSWVPMNFPEILFFFSRLLYWSSY